MGKGTGYQEKGRGRFFLLYIISFFWTLEILLNQVNVLGLKTLDKKYTYLKKRSYKWPEATEKMFRTSVSFLSFSLCKLVKLGIKKVVIAGFKNISANFIYLNTKFDK